MRGRHRELPELLRERHFAEQSIDPVHPEAALKGTALTCVPTQNLARAGAASLRVISRAGTAGFTRMFRSVELEFIVMCFRY